MGFRTWQFGGRKMRAVPFQKILCALSPLIDFCRAHKKFSRTDPHIEVRALNFNFFFLFLRPVVSNPFLRKRLRFWHTFFIRGGRTFSFFFFGGSFRQLLLWKWCVYRAVQLRLGFVDPLGIKWICHWCFFSNVMQFSRRESFVNIHYFYYLFIAVLWIRYLKQLNHILNCDLSPFVFITLMHKQMSVSDNYFFHLAALIIGNG